MKKTNALRQLDSEDISYEVLEYDDSTEVDGEQIAAENGLPTEMVFKTLVTEGKDKEHFVFVIPVSEVLDLKKAAQIAGEKKIEMVHVKDLLNLTGYVRGGCSPIGMKKPFKTFIHRSALDFEAVYVSAGKKGMQMRVDPRDLARISGARFEDVTKEG